jgi:hypothetical protein
MEAVKTHAKRFGGWWLSAAIALAIVSQVAPQQLEVVVYKVFLVNLGVVLGYVADRSLFNRVAYVDETLDHDVFGAARILCRAIAMLAATLGLTLGI